MKTYRRLALSCLTLAALLLGMLIVWSVSHGGPPAALLPPAGEGLPAGGPLTFAVLGDSRGNNTVFDHVLEAARRDGARFILHTGDIVHEATPAQFDWVLQEIAELGLKVPLCVVPGNHDLARGTTTPGLLYERAFGPRRYWFSCGDALFVALDDVTNHCDKRDLQWLDETLAGLRPRYKECFVFTHVPPRDPRPGREHCLSRQSGEALMEMLKSHDVTAVFAGHIHSYVEDRIDGIPIYITGGAGAERDVPVGPYHYLLCSVDEGGSLSARKVDVADVPDAEYAEYAFRTKFPPELVLVLGGLFLLGGLLLTWRGFRHARQD